VGEVKVMGRGRWWFVVKKQVMAVFEKDLLIIDRCHQLISQVRDDKRLTPGTLNAIYMLHGYNFPPPNFSPMIVYPL
jgi:hypothetical protein